MRVFLLTDSCTTGWLHWGHGELWLTPSQLVRIGRRELTLRAAGMGGARGGAAVAAGALGLKAVDALMGSLGSARPAPGAAIEVDPEQWEQEVAAQPARTLALNLDEIVGVQFRQGITASRLGVETVDGSIHKLLWLPNVYSGPLLAEVFGPRLEFS